MTMEMMMVMMETTAKETTEVETTKQGSEKLRHLTY